VDDSFWAADEDEDDPELDLELIQIPGPVHRASAPHCSPPSSRATCHTAAAVGQARAHLSLSLAP
jgi:hypothetical protein